MIGLTPRQAELLAYLRGRSEPWGASVDECRIALGLNSNSGIQRLFRGLIERGYVRRLPYRARSVELLSPPVIINGERFLFIPRDSEAHRMAETRSGSVHGPNGARSAIAQSPPA